MVNTRKIKDVDYGAKKIKASVYFVFLLFAFCFYCVRISNYLVGKRKG